MKRWPIVLLIAAAAVLSGCGKKMEARLPHFSASWTGPKKMSIPGTDDAQQWVYGTTGDNVIVATEGGWLNGTVNEKTYLEGVKTHLRRAPQYQSATFSEGATIKSAKGITWYPMVATVAGTFEQTYWTAKMGNRKYSLIHTIGASAANAAVEKEDVRKFLDEIEFVAED